MIGLPAPRQLRIRAWGGFLPAVRQGLLLVAVVANLAAQQTETDWKSRGLAAAQQQRYAEAAQYFQKGCQGPRRDEEACLWWARSLYFLDQHRAAVNLLLPLRPTWRGRQVLGQSYEALGEADKAEAALGEAVRLRGQTGGPRGTDEPELALGTFLYRQGRLAEAQRQLEAAVACCGKGAEPHYQLGRVLLQSGDLAAARRALQRALALQPNHAEAQFQLRKVEQRLQRQQP